jgi:hypothetical protein
VFSVLRGPCRGNKKQGIDRAAAAQGNIRCFARNVDTILPRAAERTLPSANLVRVEPNWSGAVLFQLRRSCGVPVFLSQQNVE